MSEPDPHLQEREEEKLTALETLADALADFRQRPRPLDQWERVHLASALAAVVSGTYALAITETMAALLPTIERSPSAKLPSDPVYQQFDLDVFERALNRVWEEPARRFPHFGPIDGL